MPYSARISTFFRGAQRFTLAVSACLMLGSGPLGHPSTRSVVIWSGGDGAWSQWQTPPQATEPLEFWIDGGNQIASAVFLDLDPAVGGIKIDSGDCLHFIDGHSLTIGSLMPGYLVNNGHLHLFADEGISSLIVAGGVLHAVGSGMIEMTHSTNSRIESATGMDSTFINESKIHGAGIIGDNALRVINIGEIVADRWLELLQIVPGSTIAVNHGTMRSINGGILRLHAGAYDNLAGLIIADDQSYLDIDGATLTGGTIATIGSGIARAHYDGVHLQDITIDGALEIARLTVSGVLTNNGIIDFLADNSLTPQFSELFLPAGVNTATLEGTGEMRLLLTKIFSESSVPPSLINGAGHTLRGEALLGANTVNFKNLGTVVADDESPIVFDPPATNVMVNEGTMRAEGFGGLVLTAGTFRNDGVIDVLPGSRCFYTSTATEANVQGGFLLGGTWRVDAGDDLAYILIPGPGIFFNAAEVMLSGQGSSFSIINSMIVNGGRFAIDNGRDFSTQGSFFTNEGELLVGAGCVFTVNGTFTQSAAGSLDVELAEANLVQGNPSVHVNGSAALAGTLYVRFGDEQNFSVGQRFHLLTSAALAGNFDDIFTPTGMALRIEGGDVFVEVVSLCPGDLNGDLFVNSPDLIQMLSQWGQCGSPAGYCTGDLNGDELVNVIDLMALISGWGPCRAPGQVD